MRLNFSKTKECRAIENISINSVDRNFIKEFNRRYNAKLLQPTVKMCQRLISTDNAHVYNATFGGNKIELLSGVKNSEPTVLKVKIQDGYRKLFHFFCDDNDDNFSLTKDWKGQFNEVSSIYIYEMNNHNYKKA